jgi:hypothetical protein
MDHLTVTTVAVEQVPTCLSCRQPFRDGDVHRRLRQRADGYVFQCTLAEPAPAPKDTVHARLNWSMGGGETTETLTRDQLWTLLQYGRRDRDGEVTSVTLWPTTSSDQKPELCVECGGDLEQRHEECCSLEARSAVPS